MTNAGIKGEICCQRRDVEFNWKIENFSSLSKTVDHNYHSPSFCFGGHSWHLSLYPKEQRSRQSKEFIGLYLSPENLNNPLEIRYSMGVKAANGKREVWFNGMRVFDKRNAGWGSSKCILRTDFLLRKDELVPLDVLTLTVTLKMDKKEALKKGTKDVSVQTVAEDDVGDPPQKTGGENVLQDMRRLWLSGDNSDVVIKVGDAEFKAHRAILGIRTPVLSAMFEHDTAEKESGEVTVEDCEPAAFEQLLHYIYTGAPRELNAENASALYVVADKYLVSEFKSLCVRCLGDTLCSDTFCDVVTLSLLHKEDELLQMAIVFFSKNMVDVMKTVVWKSFLREHWTWANEIMISALQLEGRKENAERGDV